MYLAQMVERSIDASSNKATCPSVRRGLSCVEGKPKEKTREVITGMGARHRRKARNKLLKSPGMKNQ